MMRFELGIEKPDPLRARTSAATIAISYVVGGLIPLSPYFFRSNIQSAFTDSILVTALALFSFGLAKAKFTGVRAFSSAVQTLAIGSIAAFVAFCLTRLFNSF
jgi:VIT1/CCC1 family predicted Fe2+/Mn2+ transporter